MSEAKESEFSYYHAGENILLYSGECKNMGKLEKGDILLGIKGNPNFVKSVRCSIKNMHVICVKGHSDIFTSTRSNIMVFDKTDEEYNIMQIPELMSDLARYKICMTTPIYTTKYILNDPYLIGLCVRYSGLTLAGIMREYRVMIAKSIDVSFRLIYDRRELAWVHKHKMIPACYVYNSRKILLRFLRGLLSAPFTPDANFWKIKPTMKKFVNSKRLLRESNQWLLNKKHYIFAGGKIPIRSIKKICRHLGFGAFVEKEVLEIVISDVECDECENEYETKHVDFDIEFIANMKCYAVELRGDNFMMNSDGVILCTSG